MFKDIFIKIGLIIIFFWGSKTVFGQFNNKSELKTVANEMISLIAKHSLVKDSMDWNKFNNDILKDINDLPIDSSSYIISNIFKMLDKYGDKHSFYMTKSEINNDKNPQYLKNISLPSSKLMDNNIGYFLLPPHKCMNEKFNYLYLDTLIKQIQILDENNEIKGWIIDLRQNRGGNILPMLAGITPFINEKIIGYFTSGNNFDKMKISTKHTPFIKETKNRYKCKDMNNKIAVLIDTLTASAGEMMAICLLGLDNSKSFGYCSAGATTMPEPFRLSNGITLLLAKRYFMDKNKNIYKKCIKPDVKVNNDKIIEEAVKWINE